MDAQQVLETMSAKQPSIVGVARLYDGAALFTLALASCKLRKKARRLHLWSSRRARRRLGGAWTSACPNVDKDDQI